MIPSTHAPRRLALALTMALTMALSAGCATLNARNRPTPEDEWPSVLSSAQKRVTDNKFDVADSLLADFATRYPGTSEARETAYWRALFRMDPSNPHQSLVSAMATLDGYLADPHPRQHAVDAASIRRVVGQLDGLKQIAATAMAQAKDATVTAKDAKAQAADAAAKAADTPAAVDEIKRLKDELAKANAELDRIRRRLAQPPPKP